MNALNGNRKMTNKEYFHNYYLLNKEKHTAKVKEYYRQHRESILKQRKAAKLHATPKMKAYYKQYAKDHPASKEAKLQSLFKCKYGISLGEFNKMVEQQANLCALCKQPESVKPRLSVDHDHITGKVRGLLCHQCNVGLGHFHDSIRLLEAAQDYLQGKTR